MRERIERLTRFAWLRALGLALVGVWFLLAPYSVYHMVKYVLLGGMLLLAVGAFVDAVRAPRGTLESQSALWRGGGLLVMALIFAVMLRPALALLPIVIGLMLVVYGISRIVTARDRQVYVNVSPFPTIIYGLVVAITGFVLLFNPFRSIMALLQVVGVMLITMGILELGDILRGHRR
ncbi:DUF308 domain-containing protein [Lacticaseibacillus jixianensis]|uniref:DUF308 domain-containing protein n=1 Tax=Lacticaseibacillus jixianensis TaxID=2486012 RepID=A0ABW4B685_9LACO|nr:DUF308 domain-containing protein [Lacticaseibacillus jixianensis]